MFKNEAALAEWKKALNDLASVEQIRLVFIVFSSESFHRAKNASEPSFLPLKFYYTTEDGNPSKVISSLYNYYTTVIYPFSSVVI